MFGKREEGKNVIQYSIGNETTNFCLVFKSKIIFGVF